MLHEPNRRPLRQRIVRGVTLKEQRKRWANARRRRAARALVDRFPRHADAPRHNLPGDLVISLTSYPPRFPTLHLTIKSLLDQKVKPDKVVLWIAHDDLALLPPEVTALEGDIFTIGECEDLRNFKKIVPTLMRYPGAFIVNADDDTYYSEDWLERLVGAFDPNQPTIVCHRAHQIKYTEDGRFAPYRQWGREVSGAATEDPRTDLLPTGNGGILYPPGSLPPMTTDIELIQRLCSTCDDMWLYFMWRRAGWKVKRVPGAKHKFVEWPDTQKQALWAFHLGGKKDEHARDMADHFGMP